MPPPSTPGDNPSWSASPAAPVQVSPRMDPLCATPRTAKEFMARQRPRRHPQPRRAEFSAGSALRRRLDDVKAASSLQDRIVFTRLPTGDPWRHGRRYRARRALCPARGCEIGARRDRHGEGAPVIRPPDEGESNLMAHHHRQDSCCLRRHLVIDIGGQDMKYLHPRPRGGLHHLRQRGLLLGLRLAWSSCQTMGTVVRSRAWSNPDLGAAAVFMDSLVGRRRRKARTLFGGVYSNRAQRTLQGHQAPRALGRRRGWGGTFLNDSVLRAFELLMTEVARRHRGPHGRVRRRLTTHARHGEGTSSLAEPPCQEPLPAISTFSNGGATCRTQPLRSAARPLGDPKSDLPSLCDWRVPRIFGCAASPRKGSRRHRHPRLGMYGTAHSGFWLTELGFRVMISGCSIDLFEKP